MSDQPVHFNPLLPAGGVPDAMPWDSGICGATPEFRREVMDTRLPGGHLESMPVEELTGYQQTYDRSKVTCQKCQDKLAEQDANFVAQQVANTIASTS